MNSKNLYLKLNFLRSMRLGIFLLLIIVALSITGIVIPQGRESSFYNEEYPGFISTLIMRLGLNNIYSSAAFALFFSALAANMFLCNTSRLSAIIKRLKQRRELRNMRQIGYYNYEGGASLKKAVAEIFHRHGFSMPIKSKSSDTLYFSSKNTLGYFGSWLLHLGIMLVILFYIYGQATYYSQEIYGVPNEIRSLNKADFKTIIRDFSISYTEDGSIRQYTTKIDLLDDNNKIIKKGSTSVNDPMRYGGYSFYQTGTGWAAQITAYKNETLIRAQVIYEGVACILPEENMAIVLSKFYPDFAADETGFFSLSDKPNNPAVLYGIYYMDELVKMDIIKPGEQIAWNDFRFTIDKPQRYTYLQVNKMNGRAGAGVAGLLIILGLLLVFYIKPGEMAVEVEGDTLRIFGNENYCGTSAGKNKSTAKLKLIENKEERINVR